MFVKSFLYQWIITKSCLDQIYMDKRFKINKTHDVTWCYANRTIIYIIDYSCYCYEAVIHQNCVKVQSLHIYGIHPKFFVVLNFQMLFHVISIIYLLLCSEYFKTLDGSIWPHPSEIESSFSRNYVCRTSFTIFFFYCPSIC